MCFVCYICSEQVASEAALDAATGADETVIGDGGITIHDVDEGGDDGGDL